MKNNARSQPKKTLGLIGLDNFATYLMNRIMARYNGRLRDKIASLGLTTPKMRALAVLTVIDAPLIGELSVYSIIENSTLSRALDSLEQGGLVRRSSDPDDSRATRVSITEAGRDAFDTVWPKMLETYESMFQGIDQAEQHAFIGTLRKMLKNVRVHGY